ncbi:hypothetical protein [Streptomyces sp. NPDC023838]|uniref:hypothetical protein n=1 Tax=Streptomyces sp. NPDC023838 TaxID=3154325 RepID=UPI0033EF60CD
MSTDSIDHSGPGAPPAAPGDPAPDLTVVAIGVAAVAAVVAWGRADPARRRRFEPEFTPDGRRGAHGP